MICHPAVLQKVRDHDLDQDQKVAVKEAKVNLEAKVGARVGARVVARVEVRAGARVAAKVAARVTAKVGLKAEAEERINERKTIKVDQRVQVAGVIDRREAAEEVKAEVVEVNLKIQKSMLEVLRVNIEKMILLMFLKDLVK